MDINQVAFGITQEVIANFRDSKEPNLGLAAWFPSRTTPAKQVSIAVQRSRQLVAVDVIRAAQSNRNNFSKYTQKLFLPPFFSEAFDFTSTQIYDVTFGMGVAPSGPQINAMIDSANEYIMECKSKIKRAIELMRASILLYGTATFVNGDSIDFKRKAASLKVLTGSNTWIPANVATANPLGDLDTGATFLRREGLSTGNVIDVIMGGNVFGYLTAFPKITTERQIFANFRRADIGMPQYDDVTGLTFQGRVGSTDFVYNLWTYADFYELDNGTKQSYIPDDMVVMIPNDFVGKTIYAGVPMVMGSPDSGGLYIGQAEGEFLVHDIVDPQRRSWDVKTESAPLPLPISIDRIYTIDVNGDN